jgi:lipopolysaccharide transport system permease protein
MYILTPLERAWHFRELIRAVVRRELAVRFRGTVLGWAWAIFGPLVMLGAYTVMFSAVIGVPPSAASSGPGAYTLSIFAGLIIFNVFSELAYRSPALLHEHADVIKRSIFPSETLAWTATIRACVYAGISFAVLLVFELIITRSIPLTALLLPFVLLPLFLFLLGMSWFLMALGCFTRDVAYLMVSIVPVLMFVTPIFYSAQDVPGHLQILIRCNLVGNYVELIRDLLLYGILPNPILYLVTVAVSLFIFVGSYRFFMRYKAVLVDVI